MPPSNSDSGVTTVERLLNTAVRLDDGRPSIISEGFSFVGDIVAQHSLHVEGAVQGNTSVSAIVVGPNGSLKGTISCGRLHVKGLVEGTVECDDLQIEATAKVSGTLEYRTLHVERGASLTGEMIVKSGPSGSKG